MELDGQNEVEIYQSHLDRVSRSFALCISRLENPQRKWVGLTYLMCRILDTIEDAPWESSELQKNAFASFDKFISSPKYNSNSDIECWIQTFSNKIRAGERTLLEDSVRIFEDFHAAPLEIRMVIQNLLRTMSKGMNQFSKMRINNELRLKDMNEVNQYCYYVAGIVGEALAKLMATIHPEIEVNDRILLASQKFGLFLQKVNLLKDQNSDEKELRFLVPSRTDVFASLKSDSKGAIEYVESIPLKHKDYRVFCLWSLFLGLKTLPLFKSEGSDNLQNGKLDRQSTMALFAFIEQIADSPTQIRELYHSLKAEIKKKDPIISGQVAHE